MLWYSKYQEEHRISSKPGAVLCAVLAAVVATALSCKPFNLHDLTPLPSRTDQPALDSAQAGIVLGFARHFPNGTQISLCLITRTTESYIGIERRNDSLLYVDNADSIFEIGSITKTFTGTMLSKLVYEGKVLPDEPIKNLLPVHLKQSSLNGREITLTHLANHTSGLPFEPTNVKTGGSRPLDPYDPYRDYGVDKLTLYLSDLMVLQSTPGERRTYSNLGFGVLGHILTVITGKTYEQLLMESICLPLGMSHTFVELTPSRKTWMVAGRDPDGEPLPLSNRDPDALVGAGGIKSSARDLVRYLKANLYDSTYFLLSQKTTKVFDEHFTASLGWATYSEFGKHHVGAFGATGGYTSGMIFERNCRVGIVLLTNVSAFLVARDNYTEKLCRALYDPLP